MNEISKKTKVAIVGFAPSWNLAPFGDEEFEIWGLNELYKLMPQVKNSRAERWFEIHNPKSPSKNIKEHQQWLRQCPVPLYMQEQYEEYPSSIKYPLKEIQEHFKIVGNGYFTNSISYMLAFAIYEGFKEIHVYGVDMAQHSEYETQRPSCEYWIGLAEGMGIKVHIPKESDLIKCGSLYGWNDNNQMRIKMKSRQKELKQRKSQHQNEIQKAQHAINQHTQAVNQIDGALEDIKFWLTNWSY